MTFASYVLLGAVPLQARPRHRGGRCGPERDAEPMAFYRGLTAARQTRDYQHHAHANAKWFSQGFSSTCFGVCFEETPEHLDGRNCPPCHATVRRFADALVRNMKGDEAGGVGLAILALIETSFGSRANERANRGDVDWGR